MLHRSLVTACCVVAWCLTVSAAFAQQSLDSASRTTGSDVVAVFEPLREILQKSSAVVLDGNKELAYGVVMSQDGWILSKATEFLQARKPAILVDRTRYDEVSVAGFDTLWDIVLLKVEAQNLVPADFTEAMELAQGTWVAANGATSRARRRLLAGIISANTREIPVDGGAVLGVTLRRDTKQLEVEDVAKRGGAEAAGIRKDDVILAVNEQQVNEIEDLSKVLQLMRVGDKVKVKWRRGKDLQEADVTLSAKEDLFAQLKTRNDAMSGDYSLRRSGFPMVLQHDILSGSRTVGGPLLILNGKCVGMNIARANRAEGFAIPSEHLREIFERLLAQARTAK